MQGLTFSFSLIYFFCTFEEAFFPNGEKTERNKGVLKKGKNALKIVQIILFLSCFFFFCSTSKLENVLS